LRPALFLAGIVFLFGCGADESPVGTDEAPPCEGKCDAIGNGALGEACSWNWQCALDSGLVCRPTSRYDGAQWTTADECAPLAAFLETCHTDSDCQDGLTCKGGLCSRRATGDDQCSAGYQPYCDGDAIVRCSYYSISREPCAEEQTCAMVSGQVTAPDGSVITLSRPECVDR
jgi:hypothetical protein